MIEFLPKWVVPCTCQTAYDTESATTLEMVARLHGKTNELIEDYNSFAERVNVKVNEFINSTDLNYTTFRVALRQEFQDFIDVINLKVKAQDNLLTDAINEKVKTIEFTINEIYHQIVLDAKTSLESEYENNLNELMAEVNKLPESIRDEINIERKRIDHLLTVNQGDLDYHEMIFEGTDITGKPITTKLVSNGYNVSICVEGSITGDGSADITCEITENISLFRPITRIKRKYDGLVTGGVTADYVEDQNKVVLSIALDNTTPNDMSLNVYFDYPLKTIHNGEINDARIGFDGTEYESLGTAIRTQLNELFNILNHVLCYESSTIIIYGNSGRTDSNGYHYITYTDGSPLDNSLKIESIGEYTDSDGYKHIIPLDWEIKEVPSTNSMSPSMVYIYSKVKSDMNIPYMIYVKIRSNYTVYAFNAM